MSKTIKNKIYILLLTPHRIDIKIMTKTGLVAINFIVLFADFACGFSGGTSNRRACLPLFASKDDIAVDSPSGGGAGSWRSKAKEFQENPTKSLGGKRLNIAFVVSCHPKIII